MRTYQSRQQWYLNETENIGDAKNMIVIIDDLNSEIQCLQRYMRLIRRVLKHSFPKHLEVDDAIKRADKHLNEDLQVFTRWLKAYAQTVADFEHENGEVDYEPLQHLNSLVSVVDELLDAAQKKEPDRGFFDRLK